MNKLKVNAIALYSVTVVPVIEHTLSGVDRISRRWALEKLEAQFDAPKDCPDCEADTLTLGFRRSFCDTHKEMAEEREYLVRERRRKN